MLRVVSSNQIIREIKNDLEANSPISGRIKSFGVIVNHDGSQIKSTLLNPPDITAIALHIYFGHKEERRKILKIKNFGNDVESIVEQFITHLAIIQANRVAIQRKKNVLSSGDVTVSSNFKILKRFYEGNSKQYFSKKTDTKSQGKKSNNT